MKRRNKGKLVTKPERQPCSWEEPAGVLGKACDFKPDCTGETTTPDFLKGIKVRWNKPIKTPSYE